MDIKDFIRESIAQIDGAIIEANQCGEIRLKDSSDKRTVEFDLAVTVGEEAEVKAGAGIKVLSLSNLNARGKSTINNTTVSRIQFAVEYIRRQ